MIRRLLKLRLNPEIRLKLFGAVKEQKSQRWTEMFELNRLPNWLDLIFEELEFLITSTLQLCIDRHLVTITRSAPLHFTSGIVLGNSNKNLTEKHHPEKYSILHLIHFP
jgi:hypothetical protein